MKPALFKNEVLGVADPIATILFIGLWTLADRRGILEDRPMRIKAEVFPYREGIDAEGLLAWLDREDFIQRYEVDGKACIQINNFAKHQNPHKNEEPSELPDAQGKYASSPKGRAGGFDPLSARPANVSPEAWADWCQHRKEIRKPLTQKACQQQAKTLESVPAPDEVLRKSIANGWMGLFPDRPGNVHPFPRRPEGPDFHSGDTTWAQDLGVL